MENGIYAKITTEKGDILISLEYKLTPITVSNFIGLSSGTLSNHSNKKNTKFYDDLVFYRVIPDFMIQGGCPNGNGMGGPGYNFKDEFHADLNMTNLEFCQWLMDPTLMGANFSLLIFQLLGLTESIQFLEV